MEVRDMQTNDFPAGVYQGSANGSRDLLRDDEAAFCCPYMQVKKSIVTLACDVAARRGLAFSDQDAWKDGW